jgi:sec-independent protein translocase protein TatA
MNTALFLFLNLGPTEIILIFFVVLLLFGGKKIPELMRGLGRGIREFNDARDNIKKEINEGMTEKDAEKQKEKDKIRIQDKE